MLFPCHDLGFRRSQTLKQFILFLEFACPFTNLQCFCAQPRSDDKCFNPPSCNCGQSAGLGLGLGQRRCFR